MAANVFTREIDDRIGLRETLDPGLIRRRTGRTPGENFDSFIDSRGPTRISAEDRNTVACFH